MGDSKFHLQEALKRAAAQLTPEILAETQYAIQDGTVYFENRPLAESPADCFPLAKILYPEYNLERLAAAEIEIAALLCEQRKKNNSPS